MSADVNSLVEAAGRLANSGRFQEAEDHWHKVLDLEPGHSQALCSLGIHALQRGDFEVAHERLCAARVSNPKDLLVLMSLANVCRQRQDPEGEREAIEAALALDAYFLPALLGRGSWQERFSSGAADTYANALKISPPEQHWPDTLRPQLEHARTVVNQHAQALNAHLTEKLAHLKSGLPPQLAERWTEAAAIRSRLSKPYVSESNQLYVPRLPAIPFFDRADFPFIGELEAKTDVIRDELLAALEADRDKFKPYIAYKPGEPVNQWQELDHSDRWSALQLYRGGSPVDENLARCPETAKALANASLADISGLCPNALFSALAPHTHIPPHNGETNARLVAHLPLIIPDNCTLRVGFETRQWNVGEIFVFDDTLEHEARNDSDELRVVLIFDVWNPLLSSQERQLVNAMAEATREFDT
jgi:aspartyl/asparaginyl beta-hydroxylase (cupin superfamily)